MPSTNVFHLSLLLTLTALLSACAGSGGSSTTQAGAKKSRYQMDHDATPTNPPDLSKLQDAKPRYEPYSRQGNKPYIVFGIPYDVMETSEGYRETGRASYYGSKFHGHLTSNGEVYDMYSMSAAHKTLPLPSYVRVTNLDNNKAVIVRVNDRGPFHSERIIDLSYGAAYKLGMVNHGVGRVQLEAIYIPEPRSGLLADGGAAGQRHYIQIVASRDKQRLNQLGRKLESQYQLTARLQSVQDFYRLQLGPIGQGQIADKLLQKIKNDGYPQSYIVTE
jgi:rare lipoprotein A